MGALTLKNFPFELRGWEIEKVESFDPTDGYNSTTLIYLNKNQIVQIEPLFNMYENNWLSDKGRHFFDAIFETTFENKKSWLKVYDKIVKTIYVFEHCRGQTSKNYFLTIVFDYLSIEVLGILIFIAQNYSFIFLKQSQPCNNINTDLESTFQLNNLSNTTLISSNLCLLVATNPRYEGHILNLNLRQRVLKRNFKCVVIGSLINLTFPLSFLGSNTNIIKTIAEGNNFICQNFKHSINSFLIYSNELFKRNDSKTINRLFKTLFYTRVINKTWYGLNVLSSSISDTAILSLNSNTKLSFKDLNNFSCIYFLNVTTNKLANFKKITELQLFRQQLFVPILLNIAKKKLFLDQSYITNNNLTVSKKISSDYLYIPTNNFYENEETYINTEGFVKRTTKIISKSKTKSSWQILRKILKHFKHKLFCFNKKDNQILFFNSNKLYNFKNFISFQYYPTKKITNLSCYLNIKNKTFIINTTKLNFKSKSKKFITTKLKYWLDDFFNSSKDKYSQNSAILTGCSVYVKHNSTNFF